jgi:hypothetical protein
MSTGAEKDSSAKPQPAPKAARSYLAATLVALLIQLVNLALFNCLCGYYGPEALPGGFVAAAIAWWGWYKDHTLAGRITGALVTIFVSYSLLWIIHNVLWSGHDPLL